MRIILFLLAFLFVLTTTNAGVYYVRIDGNNGNSGTANNSVEAWATIAYGISRIQAGDHLYIEDGLYISPKLKVANLHATEANPTIIASINIWGAKIKLSETSMWDNIFVVENCSHLELDGFEIYDTTANYGAGISVREQSKYITVRNCYVHDCGCNGIGARHSDYITIEKNVVRDNAKRSEYNCSGISIWEAEQLDENAGYHIIVRQNIAFENECRLPFVPGGFDVPTDGNGIIIDYFKAKDYTADILVENNLSFKNGGRGIHVYNTDNVTVRNNTTWHNLYVLSEYDIWKGDIEFFDSQGSNVYNNIAIQDSALPTQALRMYEAETTTEVYNNIVVGIKDFWPITPLQQNNTIKNKEEQDYPQLINPTADVEFSSREDFINFFGLQETSPAVDAGYEGNYSSLDLRNGLRPEGSKPDIGCHELGAEVSAKKTRSVNDVFIFYPNPANSVVYIDGGQDYSIQIFNMMGQLMHQQSSLNTNAIVDVSELFPGVYFLLYEEKGSIITEKIQIF